MSIRTGHLISVDLEYQVYLSTLISLSTATDQEFHNFLIGTTDFYRVFEFALIKYENYAKLAGWKYLKTVEDGLIPINRTYKPGLREDVCAISGQFINWNPKTWADSREKSEYNHRRIAWQKI